MALVNYNEKEIHFKIVYYGPALSGKTTSIQEIYKKAGGKKPEKLSIESGSPRTLFFDFVPLFLSEIKGYRTRFHLYSVPGQSLYNDSRRLILNGVDGIVFVADSRIEKMEGNLESLAQLHSNLKDAGLNPEKVPIVFQYNKRDLPMAANLKAMRETLNPGHAADFETIADKGEGVFEAFKAIAKAVISEQKHLDSSSSQAVSNGIS